MKFDKLEKLYNSIIEKKEKLEQDVKAQEAAKEQKEAEMLAAADAGDLERYKALKAEVDDLEARLFINNTQLRKIGTGALDEAEVVKAWDKYAAEYNKKFEKMLADYEDARSALYDKFMKLVDFQAEALRNRERCGYLMGMDPAPIATDANNHYRNMRLKTLETYISKPLSYHQAVLRISPETAYFTATGEADQEAKDKMNEIIQWHKSK